MTMTETLDRSIIRRIISLCPTDITVGQAQQALNRGMVFDRVLYPWARPTYVFQLSVVEVTEPMIPPGRLGAPGRPARQRSAVQAEGEAWRFDVLDTLLRHLTCRVPWYGTEYSSIATRSESQTPATE